MGSKLPHHDTCELPHSKTVYRSWNPRGQTELPKKSILFNLLPFPTTCHVQSGFRSKLDVTDKCKEKCGAPKLNSFPLGNLNQENA